MQRFYLPEDLSWKTLKLENEEINYQLQKVLRAGVGDQVIFFDWIDFEDRIFEIVQIEKRHILFTFIQSEKKTKNDFTLELYQSLPNKIEKMEMILQKGVEVWYTKFHFFRSKRSQDLRISENKFERFQKIVIEASEQSGRNDVPEIVFHKNLDVFSIAWEKYFFHTDPKIATKLKEVNFASKKINIFVGPEGGFTPDEIENFLQHSSHPVSLWNNILRTETASIGVGFYIAQQKV